MDKDSLHGILVDRDHEVGLMSEFNEAGASFSESRNKLREFILQFGEPCRDGYGYALELSLGKKSLPNLGEVEVWGVLEVWSELSLEEDSLSLNINAAYYYSNPDGDRTLVAEETFALPNELRKSSGRLSDESVTKAKALAETMKLKTDKTIELFVEYGSDESLNPELAATFNEN